MVSRRNKLGVFCLAVVVGIIIAHSFVRADAQLVTIQDGGMFVVANSYATNATYLGLTASHWGNQYSITIAQSVNSTTINFEVYGSYGLGNQTIYQDISTTLTPGTYTVYLDLGTASLAEPCYVGWSWTAQ